MTPRCYPATMRWLALSAVVVAAIVLAQIARMKREGFGDIGPEPPATL